MTERTCAPVATITTTTSACLPTSPAESHSVMPSSFAPLHRLGGNIEAGDGKALRRHVPRHLQPHGAEPDHAGAGVS